jgi:predicted nucleic acid-binding protein
MIVLDTNVVSELMRREPHPAVRAWVAARPRAALFVASVSKAEILYGIALLAQGQRRRDLAAAAEAMFAEDFAGRILAFDAAAAVHYARLAAARRQAGRPIEAFDALIAATAAAAGAAVATRDAAGFSGCGLTLLDPWQG